MSDSLRERAIALYTFLKEFAELRSEVVRHLDRYDEVLWLGEIPRERECYSAAWRGARDDAETEAWIEIRKPRLVDAPTPSDELRPWLVESEWQNSEIELRPPGCCQANIPASGLPVRFLRLSDRDPKLAIYARIYWLIVVPGAGIEPTRPLRDPGF